LGGVLIGGGVIAQVIIGQLPITNVDNDTDFLQYGWGLDGELSSEGTYYYDRYLGDPNPAYPALHAYTALPGPASAFRAEAALGIDALIGDTMPDADAEFSPDFPVDDYASLYIADDGPMNVPGAVNDKFEVNRVAADVRGAIKLCGKSSSGGEEPADPECTSQAYLYLEDGSGNLVVKFGNGGHFTIASVASASIPLE
jgi:hypothetical protein